MHSGRRMDWGQQETGECKGQVTWGGYYLGHCCEHAKAGESQWFLGQMQVCTWKPRQVVQAAWVASLANSISATSWIYCILEAKATGINSDPTVRDASAPNSLCVKTCQLCKKIPNKRYSWFTVSRFRVEVYIIYWSMIQREPKIWQQELNVKSAVSCVTIFGWCKIAH